MSLSSQIKVPAQVKGAVGGGSGTTNASDLTSGLLNRAYGGTGTDLSASGGTTKILAQDASHVISARDLVAGDIPSLAASKITSGQLAPAQGGLGVDASASTGFGKWTAGSLAIAALAAGDMPSGIDAAKIGGGAVSNTEFGYLDGVTSAIQTQLAGKASSTHDHTARHCSCYKNTTGETLTANTWTDINFEAELYDTDGFHSTSSNKNRFTIPALLGGVYVFWAYVQCSPTSANQVVAAPAVNGTKLSNQYVQWYVPTTAVYNGKFVYWVLALNDADYVGLQLKSNGANAYLYGTGDVADTGTKAGIFRIGA